MQTDKFRFCPQQFRQRLTRDTWRDEEYLVQVLNGKLFISGKPEDFFPYSERNYFLQVPQGVYLDEEKLHDLGIDVRMSQDDVQPIKNDLFVVN